MFKNILQKVKNIETKNNVMKTTVELLILTFLLSCNAQKTSDKNSSKFDGVYSVNIELGDNNKKMDGIDGSMLYNYSLKIDNDTTVFTGIGHMVYFVDECLNKIISDTLFIYYNKTKEGFSYNENLNPVLKMYMINDDYYIDSYAIESDANEKIKLIKDK